MITYMSLLQHVGVIDTLAEKALALGAPLLTASIPLAGPLLATSSLSASGTVAALAIAATVPALVPAARRRALRQGLSRC